MSIKWMDKGGVCVCVCVCVCTVTAFYKCQGPAGSAEAGRAPGEGGEGKPSSSSWGRHWASLPSAARRHVGRDGERQKGWGLLFKELDSNKHDRVDIRKLLQGLACLGGGHPDHGAQQGISPEDDADPDDGLDLEEFILYLQEQGQRLLLLFQSGQQSGWSFQRLWDPAEFPSPGHFHLAGADRENPAQHRHVIAPWPLMSRSGVTSSCCIRWRTWKMCCISGSIPWSLILASAWPSRMSSWSRRSWLGHGGSSWWQTWWQVPCPIEAQPLWTISWSSCRSTPPKPTGWTSRGGLWKEHDPREGPALPVAWQQD